MPYYVYAIHTDGSFNRLYSKYNDFHEAQKCEQELTAGGYAGDNYYVTMFYAENDADANEKAEDMRRKAHLSG